MVTSGPVKPEPADAHVRLALSEIESAERQMTGLAREQVAAIERIARRVEDAADRLESSPNKKHPSWLAANERVDTLLVKLTQWKRSGNTTTH